MKDKEIRHMAVGKLELRAAAGGSKMLVGYAAKFNCLSEDMGFRERIVPGAFARAIREKHDVRALVNHDEGKVLGRTKSGTLTLTEDMTGLLMQCSMPDTSYAADLAESIQRGDIDQQSFTFKCITDKWTPVDGVQVRDLIDLQLFDVSPVTFPAYTDTTIGLRSLERHQKTCVVVPETYRKAKLKLAQKK